MADTNRSQFSVSWFHSLNSHPPPHMIFFLTRHSFFPCLICHLTSTWLSCQCDCSNRAYHNLIKFKLRIRMGKRGNISNPKEVKTSSEWQFSGWENLLVRGQRRIVKLLWGHRKATVTQKPLVTAKCKRASLHAFNWNLEYIGYNSRSHSRYHSCQLKAGNWCSQNLIIEYWKTHRLLSWISISAPPSGW